MWDLPALARVKQNPAAVPLAQFALCHPPWAKDVVLARDLPKHRLKRGDIVKLVEHHVAPDGTEGYSAEVSRQSQFYA